MARIKVSVVTPCFNEAANIENCVNRVRQVFEQSLPAYEYEHVLVDNDSSDNSVEIMKQLAKSDHRVKVLVNSRNIGPFRNMAVGLRRTTGDLVIPMIPADLQDPPESIPALIEALTSDIDVVYGIRKNRQENFLMRAARSAYYKIVRASGGSSTPPPHAGEFLVARRNIIDAVIPALGSYPYIRGLVAQATDRKATIEYEWGVRVHGKSRNSIPDLIDQALNGIVSTAKAPIRIALLFGLLAAMGGIAYGVVTAILFSIGAVHADPGVPTLIVATAIFGGFQLLFIGLIGEYIVSVHSEVRPSPEAIQVESINFD